MKVKYKEMFGIEYDLIQADIMDDLKLEKSNDEIEAFFWKEALDIINNSELLSTEVFVQHGDISVFLHSVGVAYYSLYFSRKLGLDIDEKALIKGALLHDYCLYDWHEKDSSHRLHGFTHPKKAYNNANKIFNLGHIEKDIIIKHMFPLTIIPPKYIESTVVMIVDKVCAVYETITKYSYNRLKMVLNEFYEELSYDIEIKETQNSNVI